MPKEKKESGDEVFQNKSQCQGSGSAPVPSLSYPSSKFTLVCGRYTGSSNFYFKEQKKKSKPLLRFSDRREN